MDNDRATNDNSPPCSQTNQFDSEYISKLPTPGLVADPFFDSPLKASKKKLRSKKPIAQSPDTIGQIVSKRTHSSIQKETAAASSQLKRGPDMISQIDNGTSETQTKLNNSIDAVSSDLKTNKGNNSIIPKEDALKVKSVITKWQHKNTIQRVKRLLRSRWSQFKTEKLFEECLKYVADKKKLPINISSQDNVFNKQLLNALTIEARLMVETKKN